MHSRNLSKSWRASAWILATMFAMTSMMAAQAYKQNNLVSDLPGLAPVQDPHLVNPWGLISSSTSPWWVSDNNGGVATLYTGTGAIVPLVVNIPPVVGSTGTGTPTGVVFTRGSAAIPGSTFHFGTSTPQSTAVFTFVAEDGRISAWPGKGDAVTIVDNSANPSADNSAVYKGATVAQMTPGGPSFLYVANFRAGRIEIYDNTFHLVTPHNDEDRDGDDAFTDREIRHGFAPFNVQEVNGSIYVTYARQNAAKHDDFDFPGLGFVDKFSPTGKLQQRLERGPWLNAPWGVALAPADFGFFSNHLLIGNAGSGQIAVYDAASGHFDGLLRDAGGHAIQNDRLWALRFGNGAAAGPANWLFFTAGISDESHGLFGFFVPDDKSAPETGRDDK